MKLVWIQPSVNKDDLLAFFERLKVISFNVLAWAANVGYSINTLLLLTKLCFVPLGDNKMTEYVSQTQYYSQLKILYIYFINNKCFSYKIVSFNIFIYH